MSDSTSPAPLLNNAQYNILKMVVTVILPALGTLYYALSQLWHFPHTEEVVGSLAAVATFCGVVLGFSTISYNNAGSKYSGTLNVIDPGDGSQKLLSVGLDTQVEAIQQQKDVTFKVNPNT